MAALPPGMANCHAREMTFEQPHQLTKRRASSNTSKRKAANTVSWPHTNPTPHALARAGFFYRPSIDSDDNVQCFHCGVKLDGWEETDDPVKEHLAHSHQKPCRWAVAVSVGASQEEPDMRDPMSAELSAARRETFMRGDGWPHESKKAWKCKVNKLVEAGWCWDPSPGADEPDGVTCFYCGLSLDGWEPKDDPLQEHKKRAPDCHFFALLQHYHGSMDPPKKGKGRGKARGSTASKASRISTQSVLTAASEALSRRESLSDIPVNSSLGHIDDSVLTTATTISTATATKGSKKATKAKAAPKTTRGKKKVSEVEEELRYPDLDQAHNVSRAPVEDSEVPPVPLKSPKRTARTSKQVIDSSVVEISAIEAGPLKKTTRARKPKAQSRPEPEVGSETGAPHFPQTPDADAILQKRLSEVSMQLQEELEHSVDNFGEELDQSTSIAIEPAKPKRGIKRNSDGSRKRPESSVLEMEPELGAQQKPAPKAKRVRNAKQTSTASTDADSGGEPTAESQASCAREHPIEIDHPFASQDADADDEKTQPKGTKEAAKKGKGRPKGKKNSSTSSAKTDAEPHAEPWTSKAEDLACDEMEIEQELQRMAFEHATRSAAAVQVEQDLVEEYEPSPSQGRISKDNNDIDQLQQEIEAETEQDKAVQAPISPIRQSLRMPGGFTPSPSGSDKENVPSSAFQPGTAQKAPAVVLSPTKITRIPLAPGTPNRSPAKSMLSPSKQVSGLLSSAPWTAVDIDATLLPSPQPSPGKVSEQLAAAAGALTSPEKQMTVEEWIRHRAVLSEAEMRRKCERRVEAFEREGMRALATLNGINVIG